MKIISSRYTFASKKLFPILWFGILAVFVFASLIGDAEKQSPVLGIIPVIMAVLGYVLLKKLLWDLMDEVVDHGDYLAVKYRGQEDIIYLNNIMNISASTHQNPPRITLRLRTPGKFGQDISFIPASEFSVNPFKKNAVAEDLMLPVDKTRW